MAVFGWVGAATQVLRFWMPGAAAFFGASKSHPTDGKGVQYPSGPQNPANARPSLEAGVQSAGGAAARGTVLDAGEW